MMDCITMSQNNKTNSLWTEISKFMNQDKFKRKLFISGLLLQWCKSDLHANQTLLALLLNLV